MDLMPLSMGFVAVFKRIFFLKRTWALRIIPLKRKNKTKLQETTHARNTLTATTNPPPTLDTKEAPQCLSLGQGQNLTT
jgi:hypothetical protein